MAFCFTAPVQCMPFFQPMESKTARNYLPLVLQQQKPFNNTATTMLYWQRIRAKTNWCSRPSGISIKIYKMSALKNDLLLRALRKEKVERPPVWMMRQAGRYLPDYIKLREKYDFFTRCQTPELATEITLQPIDQVGVDAAIIFSDILVIPQAMGVEVLMEEGKGPSLPKTIKTQQDIDALNTADAEHHLKYVMDALSMTKRELNGRVPLIGFAGAPWTILCYMVEGKGSKTWDKAKQFAYTQPQLAHALLQKITNITIDYLKAQVKAGADTVQVFDSWAGSLSPEDFKNFAQPYLFQISDAVSKTAPVILFPKGSWYALKEISS